MVTGPHDVTNDGKYDAGVHTRLLEAPASLALQPGELPVVAFFTFSQYSAFGEVTRDSSARCSLSWSDESGHQHKTHVRSGVSGASDATLLVVPLARQRSRARLLIGSRYYSHS